MVDTTIRTQGIVEPMREPVRRLGKLVRELGGDNARSLTLFGAIAAGTFDATQQTARSVLLLDRMDLNLLRRLAEHGAKLGKEHIAAPLMMTREYVMASLDTFPLEFIEIKQMHMTVFGEDLFAALTFHDEHVRLGCEREFKSILLRLRQGLLAAAGRDRALDAVMAESAEGIVRTMRGLLWLKGEREGSPSWSVIESMERSIDRRLTGVRAAVNAGAVRGWEQFEQLYGDVEALAEKANA